jgi:hypothetical protein
MAASRIMAVTNDARMLEERCPVALRRALSQRYTAPRERIPYESDKASTHYLTG